MLFSVGTFYAVLPLLDLILKSDISQSEFLTNFKHYESVPSNDVLELSLLCNWVSITNGKLSPTTNGRKLLELSDKRLSLNQILRVQLKDLILEIKPDWRINIVKGRSQIKERIPSEIHQCLEEAKLLAGYEYDVIQWWDYLSTEIRKDIDNKKLTTGRLGESLSLKYEHLRTGVMPKWESVESDIAGYDIKSKKSRSNCTPLYIEVKTSFSGCKFYLTKHQWETALSSSEYIFHLWLLHPLPTLYIIDVYFLEKHVPVNIGDGCWEEALIKLEKCNLDNSNRIRRLIFNKDYSNLL
ncbi:protein NO VEIN domain-containing protein, partial [Cytobacillus firmus]